MTQFVCFCHWLSGKKICRTRLVHLHISEPTLGPSHTWSHQSTPPKCSSDTARAGIVENFPFACWIPPLKFGQIFTLFFIPQGQIFTLFFIPQGAAPRKGSTKPQSSLTARLHPPQAVWTLQTQKARARNSSSSFTTPQTSWCLPIWVQSLS